MNRFRLLFSAVGIFLTATAFSQLKFEVKSMPDAYTFGVYVKPCGDVMPSANTITGTGQATVILPVGSNVTNLIAVSGVWVENSSVSGPAEAPNNNYFSYGFLADSPQIVYQAGEETLLFTFKVEGGGQPTMLDNDNDPFAIFPNSLGSNPGNEMSVIDGRT